MAFYRLIPPPDINLQAIEFLHHETATEQIGGEWPQVNVPVTLGFS